MSSILGTDFRFTETDLEFLIEAASPEVRDKAKLRHLLREDEDFRNGFIGDKKTCEKVLDDEEVFLRISPHLYFQILLRKTFIDLQSASHTIEKAGTQKIAVFDTKDVIDLLSEREVVMYLADMLSSFTRVESYTLTYRVKKGSWRKIRFNDLDIDSLIRFCAVVEDDHRLGFFQRIADICLFIMGVFPEYVRFSYQYPYSGEKRPHLVGWIRRSMEDYELEGKKYYKLAAEHEASRKLGLSKVFWLLYQNFQTAKKPLNFMAEHYLHYKRRTLFGVNA